MDSKRLTRRQLGLATTAAALPAMAAQQPPAGELEAARSRVKSSGETLRKVKLPQLLEPSFAFRP